MLLVEAWQCVNGSEQIKRMINERETFVDTMGIKRTELEDKLLF